MTQFKEVSAARPRPDAPHGSILQFRRPGVAPLTGTVRIGGHEFAVAVWTAEAWAALPAGDRPPDAGKLSGGGWCLITPR